MTLKEMIEQRARLDAQLFRRTRPDYKSFVMATKARIQRWDNEEYSQYDHSTDLISISQSLKGDVKRATVLHELIHWTGHHTRLSRNNWTTRDEPNFFKEELVANIAAAYLTAYFNLNTDAGHHTIMTWYKRLNRDRDALFTAAHQAYAAVDYLKQFSEVVP